MPPMLTSGRRASLHGRRSNVSFANPGCGSAHRLPTISAALSSLIMAVVTWPTHSLVVVDVHRAIRHP